MLKVVARTLLDIKSDVNLVGRIGGDEFCAFVGEAVTDEEITEVGKSLISHFADYLEEVVFAGNTGTEVAPTPEDVAGFNAYIKNYIAALPVEEAAVKFKK